MAAVVSGYDCADELEEMAAENPLMDGRCERPRCARRGLVFSDDGEFLCEEHFESWVTKVVEEATRR